jgi:periplasmic divalent cation tolerance protein
LHDHPAIVVFTNVPDNATARALAQALLDERLAACVNIGAPVDSMYHWRGGIETAREIPVAIKTRAALYTDVEAAIRNIHPYDTPEIIAIQVAAGDERYLRWIAAEARSG